MKKKNIKRMDVWLSDIPSLEVLEIYVREAKKRKVNFVCFDVPIAIEYGLSRTYFHLKII